MSDKWDRHFLGMALYQLPHSAMDAEAVRSSRYFNGKPCKTGHLSYRFTSNHACAACVRSRRRGTPELRHADNRRRARLKKATPEKRARRNRRERLRQSQRLSRILRNRLNLAVTNGTKAGSAVSDLGCTIAELRRHIEAKFAPGMTWENYGDWHIDHLVPLALFDLANRGQLLKACHYTNLQPLWASENQRKGASLPTEALAKDLLTEAGICYRELSIQA